MEFPTIRTDKVIPINGHVDIANLRANNAFTLQTPVSVKVDAFPATKASVVNPVAVDATSLAVLWQYTAGVVMSAGTKFDMPSGWVPGTTVVPYIQIMKEAGGPGTVDFTLNYRASTDGVALGLVNTVNVVSDLSLLTANTPMTIYFPAVDMTSMILPCDMALQLVRNGGADTYANNILLAGIGATVSVNRLGL